LEQKNGLQGLEKVNQIESELIICELITQKKMGVTWETSQKKTYKHSFVVFNFKKCFRRLT
jgi:hypothetical protein